MLRGLLLAALLLPASATAQVHLDIEAGTEFPVAIGADLSLELPFGIRASTGLGFVPKAYVSVVNDVVTSLPNAYDESTATLIEETLQRSLSWRTHVGYSILLGLYVDVGYRFLGLGGGTGAAEILEAATGLTLPAGVGDRFTYSVNSSLHMIDAEIGWAAVFHDALTVRVSIGVAATVAASTTVQQDFEVQLAAAQKAVDEFERFSEEYLVDTYTSYVHAPVVTIALGYRIF